MASEIINLSNVVLGNSQTFGVKQNNSTDMHTIKYSCGSLSGTIIEKSRETSITWTPPLEIASEYYNQDECPVSLTITTFSSDGTNIGSLSKTFICTVPDTDIFRPSASIEISDLNGYDKTFGKFLNLVSEIQVKINITSKYSPVAKCVTYQDGYSKSNATSFTIIPSYMNMQNSITVSLVTTITDMRGRSTTYTTEVVVYSYEFPLILVKTVTRCDANGTRTPSGKYLKLTFDANITSIDEMNAAEYSVQYKKKSDTTYTTVWLDNYLRKYTIQEGTFVFSAETDSAYDIILTAVDSFTSIQQQTTGSSITPLRSIFRNGLGIAWGKLAELADVFDIGFKTRFHGGILPVVLPEGTNIDDVKTPNIYTGTYVNTYTGLPDGVKNYGFSLEVLEANSTTGILIQRLSWGYINRKIYERIFMSDTWWNWTLTSGIADNEILWSGAVYPSASDTIYMSKSVGLQRTGIVLVFSHFDEEDGYTEHYSSVFIPKGEIESVSGAEHVFTLASSKFGSVATKRVYIDTLNIKGHDDNSLAGTANGITYNNANFFLRYVIGV